MPASGLEARAARAILSLPDTALRLMSGGKTEIDGKVLDARCQMGLFLNRTKPKLESQNPAGARRQLEETIGAFDLEEVALPRVETFSVPILKGAHRVRVRLYSPHSAADRVGAMPAMVYFHGGGFVLGDVDSHDGMLRYLAREAGMIVLAVDYRLAPEHRFPAAHEDAFGVYEFFTKNGAMFDVDSKRLAVGGDSAGGNLAVHVCREALKKKLRAPQFQLLFYPWLDLSAERPSYQTYGEGFGLTTELIRWFKAHAVLNQKDLSDQRLSPLLAKSLRRLPPAHIQIAGFDPLQDEAREYAERLQADRVSVTVQEYPELIHSYAHLGGIIPAARLALYDAARAAEKLFHAGTA